MEVPVFLFFAGLIGVAPAAVPERIDAQPVSVWVATAGLVDDRPPLLVVDRRVLEMDAGLAGAAGWEPLENDWRHGLATDLAEDSAHKHEQRPRKNDYPRWRTTEHRPDRNEGARE